MLFVVEKTRRRVMTFRKLVKLIEIGIVIEADICNDLGSVLESC